jgi:Nif-specific regulatory protein
MAAAMNDSCWLRAGDCPLLQAAAGGGDSPSLRVVQRLLELLLRAQSSDALMQAALEEIANVLRAGHAAVLEATPGWAPRWHFSRRRLRDFDPLPCALLSEVLDREAGTQRAPAGGGPAFVAACLSFRERANRVLLASRSRDPFTRDELEYTVAAGHYLGAGLERAGAWDDQQEALERLHSLVAIARQLVEQRETVPLLEHIAKQAASLLRCERASIFLWDQAHHQLVGRPALGLPGGELRIPDNVGVVGKVVQTGQTVQVTDVHQQESEWNSRVDTASGFRTRNLLCVPLVDSAGVLMGALEVLNKNTGHYSGHDVETLQALAAQTSVALRNVREREGLLRNNAQLEGQVRKGARLVGESTALQGLRVTVERVGRTELPVLILGESGTGKEVVASTIHYGSPRRQQPFIPVNCAAIAETLLESELFGHEKGAFTDAHTTRPGKFESATGGTLFLDEIGDLSAGGQAKLLRVLEEKVVYRVGGSHAIPVDTRIVAATNRNLAETVRAGKFREDLFYRLTVVTIELPPLRDRREDILLLADYFLEQFARDAGRRRLRLSAEARRRLEQHDWPGNIRELRNLMERVAFLCAGDKVEPSDLAFVLRPAGDVAGAYADLPLAEATRAFERDNIARTLERTRNNMTDAANLLGVHRSNLYRKMRLLGMEIP